MAQIDVHDLGRIRAITGVLVKHGFGQLVRQAGLELSGEAIDTSLPIGRRLRLVCTELGTTFVKLGQVISVRPDLVPREIAEELAGLQDRVPPEPIESVRRVIEGDAGRPLEDIYEWFDPTPIASASVAQVHRAKLRTGRVVAVKVQREGIEKTIRSDLHILTTLANLVGTGIELPGLYSPLGIVQEFESAMNMELDFLQEARAAQRFRRNFAKDERIVVPEVFLEHSSRRVLVLELLDGVPFAAHEKKDGATWMRALIHATYDQVFEHGFFHGDPHPGNLLCMPDGRVAFLDFGLCGTLTAPMQDTLMNVFVGLVFRDAETVAVSIYRAGATDDRVDLKAFRGEIERLLAKYHGASLADLSKKASLVELIEVASRFRIRLPSEYAVLARAGSIIDGLAKQLLPDVDIVAEVSPYAQRLVGRRLSPERIGTDAVRLLQQAQITLQDVPTQMNQLLVDLQRGKLLISTIDPEAALLRDEIRIAGLRVAMALSVMALLIGGAVLVAPWAPSPLGIPLQAMFGSVVAFGGVMLFMALVLHALVAERLRPRELFRRAVGVWRFFFGTRS